MDDHPFQLVLVMVSISLVVMVDTFTSVGKDIQNLRKFTISVQLELLHGLEIKLESFQCDNENLRQSFQAHSFHSFHLVITLLTKIGIITFKNLSLDKLIKSFFKIFLILDLQSNTHKRLNSFRGVFAFRSNNKISQLPSK